MPAYEYECAKCGHDGKTCLDLWPRPREHDIDRIVSYGDMPPFMTRPLARSPDIGCRMGFNAGQFQQAISPAPKRRADQ